MHRFYLPPEECGTDLLFLGGSEAHHALRVLRIRSGEPVKVLDGAGRELICRVESTGRDRLELAVVERHGHPPPPAEITLVQAIPKGKIIESIIQKATELGAARIVPLLTQRVATHIDASGGDRKAGKWQTVAIEAIKQCGAPWLPRVLAPVTPAEYLVLQEPIELALIASLQPGSQHPRAVLNAFHAAHSRPPRSLAVWIGPEGDFSAEEIALIQDSGACPITLGPLVLRVETAAVYCLSILNYELRA